MGSRAGRPERMAADTEVCQLNMKCSRRFADDFPDT